MVHRLQRANSITTATINNSLLRFFFSTFSHWQQGDWDYQHLVKHNRIWKVHSHKFRCLLHKMLCNSLEMLYVICAEYWHADKREVQMIMTLTYGQMAIKQLIFRRYCVSIEKCRHPMESKLFMFVSFFVFSFVFICQIAVEPSPIPTIDVLRENWNNVK